MRSCNQPRRTGEGTSPNTWMTITCSDIANGRSRAGTDHSTTAVLGACNCFCNFSKYSKALHGDMIATLTWVRQGTSGASCCGDDSINAGRMRLKGLIAGCSQEELQQKYLANLQTHEEAGVLTGVQELPARDWGLEKKRMLRICCNGCIWMGAYLNAKDGELPGCKGRYKCQQRGGHSKGQQDEHTPEPEQTTQVSPCTNTLPPHATSNSAVPQHSESKALMVLGCSTGPRDSSHSKEWGGGSHPMAMPPAQMARALPMVEPMRSSTYPPVSVPNTPVSTVTAPNTRSAVSPLIANTSLPAFGPRYAIAPMKAAAAHRMRSVHALVLSSSAVYMRPQTSGCRCG